MSLKHYMYLDTVQVAMTTYLVKKLSEKIMIAFQSDFQCLLNGLFLFLKLIVWFLIL